MTLAVAESASATVSVSTFNGEFESDFPVTLEETRKGKRFSFTLGGGQRAGHAGVVPGHDSLVRPGHATGRIERERPRGSRQRRRLGPLTRAESERAHRNMTASGTGTSATSRGCRALRQPKPAAPRQPLPLPIIPRPAAACRAGRLPLTVILAVNKALRNWQENATAGIGLVNPRPPARSPLGRYRQIAPKPLAPERHRCSAP